MQEEVTKVQSNLHLDLNLEKGRIKEEVSIQWISVTSYKNGLIYYLWFRLQSCFSKSRTPTIE